MVLCKEDEADLGYGEHMPGQTCAHCANEASKRILTFKFCTSFETAQKGCSSLVVLYFLKKMKNLSVSFVLWLNIFKLASGLMGPQNVS